MNVIGMLPVRLESTRLPGKALKDINGLPAIVHVFKRCSLANSLDEVYVVTDSRDVKAVVEAHGGKVILTGKHRNGSERIYEAYDKVDADIIVNIQGDEILVEPEHIDLIVNTMVSDPSIEYSMGVTPFSKVKSTQDFKAVTDLSGNLLYCSRADIPCSSISCNDDRLKMVFIVGFTKASLKQFVEWDETPLELREPNEFLRILENGKKIKTVFMDNAKISLDTAEDLEEIRQIMKSDGLFLTGY